MPWKPSGGVSTAAVHPVLRGRVGDQLPPFDTVVQSLRCSIEATLATSALLGGKLVHIADTGDVAIRCPTSDDGVRFVFAEFHGERALAVAASATQATISEMTEDPVWDRFLNVSGSSSFRAYEAADFRWGTLKRTVPVTMNHDGHVALVHDRDGGGK